MSFIEANRVIEAPLASVWGAIADFARVEDFDPYVRTSKMLTSQRAGVGAARRLTFEDGSSASERVTDWYDGAWMQVEVFEHTLPVEAAAISVCVHATDGGTLVSMAMDYAPAPGFFGALVDRWVVRGQFERHFAQVLAGLDGHVRKRTARTERDAFSVFAAAMA